jgi:hypothetical protein
MEAGLVMDRVFDCHVHAFGPLDLYPAMTERDYDPPALAAGRVFVKLSATYQISSEPPPWNDVAPLAVALIERARSMCSSPATGRMSEPPSCRT